MECVLAGTSGTHSVCFCTIPQSVKLMVIVARLSSLTEQQAVHEQHGLNNLSATKTVWIASYAIQPLENATLENVNNVLPWMPSKKAGRSSEHIDDR